MQAGRAAISLLAQSAEIPGDIAQECLELVINSRTTTEKNIQDGIITGLLHESDAAKRVLVKRLQESPIVTFEELYEIGDGSANAIASIVLERNAWITESGREASEKDVFQLFLAKLMEAGDDLNGRALRGISRLLATDGESLHELLDEETFMAILSSLDYRLPKEVQSQATLATAKYLDNAEEKGRIALTNFFRAKVARHNGEDLVLAFSAAAAIFPLAPSIASTLFLTDGFTSSLIPLLETKVKSRQVKRAALEMISAACMDTACREAISKHCIGWLQNIVDIGEDEASGLAAVILAKVGDSKTSLLTEQLPKFHNGTGSGVDKLLLIFKRMIADHSEANKQSAVEGIAHASVQPPVKEALVNDKDFLEMFFSALRNSQSSPTIIFGGLTIIDNITRYLPILSEEQKRMSQLKAYANAKKPAPEPDALNEDVAVTKRCVAMVQAGAIPTLVAICKKVSTSSTSLALNIFLSFSRTSSQRGTIAQQGGIKFLLHKYTLISGNSPSEIQSRRTAAHAVGRILISVDPTLVFSSGFPPLTSAIRPLTSLLTEDPSFISEGPRDLLPVFEALLALTNLASTPSNEAAETIIRVALPTIEDLLLGNNKMIQRASTELVCNLMACSAGVEIFADRSKAAARRLHILLALADVDDDATRKAAGGALATITEFEGAVEEILARDRGIEILLRLVEDDDEGVSHRGVVCIRNISYLDGATGVKARETVKSLQGISILNAVLQKFNNRAVLETAVEALKAIMT